MSNNSNNIQYPISWQELISCPNCGENNIKIDDDIINQGICSACEYVCYWADNVLSWRTQQTKHSKQGWGLLFKQIKNQLNPMSNYFLPFRHIARISDERYYQKTLYDKILAKKWHEHYVKDLHLKQDDIVLDFGCGRGRMTALSNQMGLNTYGQDIKKNAWWKQINNSRFQVVPEQYNKLPWRSNIFSAVLIFAVIHYLKEEKLRAYVQEIFRILKPGGYCIMLEANTEGCGARLPLKYYGDHMHTLADMRQLLQVSGFNELAVSYEGFYSPIFPLIINFIRNQFSFKPYDLSDFDTYLESITAPEKRANWLMKIQKPMGIDFK